MVEKEPSFWQYVTTDEDGFVNGISDKAPDDAKVEYDRWIKKLKELAEQGIKT